MKKIIILLLLLTSIVWSQSNSGISVSGSGTVYGEPDIAIVEFGVNITHVDINEATQEANQIIKDIMTVLNQNGIEDQDVRTASFNIWFEEAYEANRKAQYRVNNVLSVTVRDIDNIGAVLAQSIEAGANSVNNIQYAIADTQPLSEQARELAMQDATAKAQQLAELAAVELGNVITINLGSSLASMGGGGFYEDAAFRSSSVPVSGGQLAVSSSVSVLFAIDSADKE